MAALARKRDGGVAERRSAVAGFERLLALPVSVEAVATEPLQLGGRETTVVRLHGGGVDGFGEDVTHDAADRAAFRRLDLSIVPGATTLEQALARLSRVDLSVAATHVVVASYRRWAVESALIDLALGQAGLSLATVLDLPIRPVRFVVSPRGDGREAAPALVERAPSLRLKLDPRSDWTRGQIEQLASLAAVEVLDLKGTYPGTAVYQPPDVRLYRDLVQVFPDAWLEDPALTDATVEALRLSVARVAWDEPVQAVADVDRLGRIGAINVKPSRLGSLAEFLALVAVCGERGIVMYGGGQSEIGPGRDQIQLLAALFYPDGPNDVAPVGYDDPFSEVVRSSEPLVVQDAVGFRSGAPG